MIKIYYNLIKPGIIYGNALTLAAGFFLGAKDHPDFNLLLASLFGLSLVIASGCVFNNLLDSDIDNRMERTKNRALVTGAISKQNAIFYGLILGLVGSLILTKYTNLLDTLIGLAGFFVYVALYTPLKRRSVHATLIGAVAGSVPPLVGYTAATRNFDLGAVLLFLILVFWQMPHFYAIGIYRLKDYASAGLPIMPVKKGIAFTKINMLVYIVAFIIVTSLLTVFGFTGYIYLAAASILGLTWLVFAIKGFKENTDEKKWARKMFFFSLLVITLLCVIIPVDSAVKYIK